VLLAGWVVGRVAVFGNQGSSCRRNNANGNDRPTPSAEE
jgi:hypothetical protein